MAVRWMVKNPAADFTHDLRRPILDSSYLVKMVLIFRLALVLKDVPFHPTSKVSLQLPCAEFIIHHLGLEDIVLLFLWANTF